MSEDEELPNDEWKEHFLFWMGALAHEDPKIRRKGWITLEAMCIARDEKVDMDTAFNWAIKIYKKLKEAGKIH